MFKNIANNFNYPSWGLVASAGIFIIKEGSACNPNIKIEGVILIALGVIGILANAYASTSKIVDEVEKR